MDRRHLVFSAALSTTAHAGGARLRAGVVDQAPWGWRKGPQHCGLYVRWLSALAQQVQCSLMPAVLPLRRLTLMLQRNELDLALMPAPDEGEAPPPGISLGSAFRLPLVVLHKPSRALLSPDALRGRRVGVLRGTHFSSEFLEIPGMQLVEFGDVRQQVGMLLLGRLDAVAGVRQNFEAALAELRLPPNRLNLAWSLGERGVHLWLSPGLVSDPMADRLRRALRERAGRLPETAVCL